MEEENIPIEPVTFEEKINCIIQLIGFQKRVVEVWTNENAAEVAKAKRAVVILEAIKEDVEFERGLEQFIQTDVAPNTENANVQAI